MSRMIVHKSVTAKRVERMARRALITCDNPGICLHCGKSADGCEPDASFYECDHCKRKAVFGAEEIMICGYYHPSVSTR